MTVLRLGEIHHARIRYSIAGVPNDSKAWAFEKGSWLMALRPEAEGVTWMRGHGADIEAALLLVGSAAT